MDEARKLLPDVAIVADAYEAIDGADGAGDPHRMERVPRARPRAACGSCCRRRSSSICATSIDPAEMARPASTITASAGRRRALPGLTRRERPRWPIAFDPTVLREYDIRGIVGKTLHRGAMRARSAAPSAPWCARSRRQDGRRRLRRAAAARPSWSAALVEGSGATGLDGGAHRPRRRRRCCISPSTISSADGGDHGHRLAQPARLQRLQDDARQEAVLRRADPASSAGWPRAATVAEGTGQRRATRCQRRLCRAPADGLRRQRRDAERRLGHRQRRGRRRAAPAGRRDCPGEHIAAERRRSTAPSPPTTPTRPCRKNLVDLHAAGRASTAPISASPSTATATASASSTARPDPVGRPAAGDLARDVLTRAPGRHHHRRRQGEPGAVRRDRAARRQAADVEDRPFADQGEDGGDGSPLAGEMSGHIFFADKWYGFDDALYAAVRLLGIVGAVEGHARRAARRAAAGGQHARAALRLRRRAQVRGDRGGHGAARRPGAEGRRHRRRAGDDRRTAGGCCAPPTPRPCWSPAPRRPAPPGWSG